MRWLTIAVCAMVIIALVMFGRLIGMYYGDGE